MVDTAKPTGTSRPLLEYRYQPTAIGEPGPDLHISQEITSNRFAPTPGSPLDPRPALQWVLDGINPPAIIRNGRMDLLATNHLGRAMHASLYDSQPGDPPNFARYTFLDDDSHRFYRDWDTAADTCVAILRTEAGREPHDKALHDLVGELSRSAKSSANVGAHTMSDFTALASSIFHHTTVGNLELAYESVDMISDPGLTLTIYVAEPASPTAHALDLLASWNSSVADTDAGLTR
jgi:hypothetical protein